MKMNAMHQFAMSKFATSQSRDDAMLEEIDMLQGKVKDLSAVLNHHKTLKAENAALRAEVDRQRDELMTQGRQWLEDRAELASMTLERQMRLMAEQSNVKLQAELAALKAGDVVMVPREPTKEMIEVGNEGFRSPDARRHSVSSCYQAMLAAAPGVQAGEKDNAVGKPTPD